MYPGSLGRRPRRVHVLCVYPLMSPGGGQHRCPQIYAVLISPGDGNLGPLCQRSPDAARGPRALLFPSQEAWASKTGTNREEQGYRFNDFPSSANSRCLNALIDVEDTAVVPFGWSCGTVRADVFGGHCRSRDLPQLKASRL